MSILLAYLNTLDKDAAVREAHNKDPQAAMTTFGLSATDQSALLSGDRAKVAAIGISSDQVPAIIVPHTTY